MQTNLRLQLSQSAYMLRTMGFLQVWLHCLLPRREAGRHKAGENNSRHVHSCGLTQLLCLSSACIPRARRPLRAATTHLECQKLEDSTGLHSPGVCMQIWLVNSWKYGEVRNSISNGTCEIHPVELNRLQLISNCHCKGLISAAQIDFVGSSTPMGTPDPICLWNPSKLEELWMWLQMEDLQGCFYGLEGHLSPFLFLTFIWKSHSNLPLRRRENEVLEVMIMGCINLPNPANAWKVHVYWQDECSRCYLTLYGLWCCMGSALYIVMIQCRERYSPAQPSPAMAMFYPCYDWEWETFK